MPAAFPVSVQTPEMPTGPTKLSKRSPKGNNRKSYLECQRPSISPFFPPESSHRRRVCRAKLGLTHETHFHEGGNSLLASRSCSRTFDIFGEAMANDAGAQDPSSVAKFVLLVVRPCKTSSHFPRLHRNTHARTRAYTTMHTIRRNTNTRMCTL